jgi:hypothetical protein
MGASLSASVRPLAAFHCGDSERVLDYRAVARVQENFHEEGRMDVVDDAM